MGEKSIFLFGRELVRLGSLPVKGRPRVFQLVLLLVCFSLCVCTCINEGVEFYRVDFPPLSVDTIKCLLVLAPAACFVFIPMKVRVWGKGGEI